MKTLILLALLLVLPALQASEIKFEGVLAIKENKRLQANYKLIAKGPNQYDLELRPQGTTTACLYQVKRISAPQQTRGMKGKIFSNQPKNCRFQSSDKETEMFWNSLVLIDFSYNLNKTNQLEGSALAKSLKKEFLAELIFQ